MDILDNLKIFVGVAHKIYILWWWQHLQVPIVEDGKVPPELLLSAIHAQGESWLQVTTDL
jgi:hypothetical protein